MAADYIDYAGCCTDHAIIDRITTAGAGIRIGRLRHEATFALLERQQLTAAATSAVMIE